MRSVVLTILFSAAATGGQIRGIVVDATGAAVESFIRIVESDSEEVPSRFRSEPSGLFQTKQLHDGVYFVTAWSRGFRRREFPKVVVQSGAITDLNEIKLELSGCDAPGVTCDEFIASSEIKPSTKSNIVNSGDLRLKVEDGINLDMRLSRKNSTLYLEAVNGASMSTPNSSNFDCSDAKYSKSRFRANGLGSGVDFCIRNKNGDVSHVFFTDDVERDTTEITLHFVTRKRSVRRPKRN